MVDVNKHQVAADTILKFTQIKYLYPKFPSNLYYKCNLF